MRGAGVEMASSKTRAVRRLWSPAILVAGLWSLSTAAHGETLPEALVRVYAVLLALGPAGFGRTIAGILGSTLNSLFYTEFMVIAGLLHFTIPMAALALLGTVQSINPKLSDP